jgi:hypothetical protein
MGVIRRAAYHACMGHIAIDSPFAPLLQPGVLTFNNLEDSIWKMNVRDMGARYLMAPRTFFVLDCVRNEKELLRSRAAYTFSACRWDFSPDVDPDRVGVLFTLGGVLYEIPALDPNDLARIRIPRPVPLLEAPA